MWFLVSCHRSFIHSFIHWYFSSHLLSFTSFDYSCSLDFSFLSLVEEKKEYTEVYHYNILDQKKKKKSPMAEGQPLSNINYSLQDYSTSIEYFDKVDQQMSSIDLRFSSCSFSDWELQRNAMIELVNVEHMSILAILICIWRILINVSIIIGMNEWTIRDVKLLLFLMKRSDSDRWSVEWWSICGSNEFCSWSCLQCQTTISNINSSSWKTFQFGTTISGFKRSMSSISCS